LNGRDLRQLPLIKRKEKLRALIEKSGLSDVICSKYVEGRGIDLYREVCHRNLEGVLAKRKAGTYAAVSGWLKIKTHAIHKANSGTNCSNRSRLKH
jgi:bifunctional non-homologous end joining protein LigD